MSELNNNPTDNLEKHQKTDKEVVDQINRIKVKLDDRIRKRAIPKPSRSYYTGDREDRGFLSFLAEPVAQKNRSHEYIMQKRAKNGRSSLESYHSRERTGMNEDEQPLSLAQLRGIYVDSTQTSDTLNGRKLIVRIQTDRKRVQLENSKAHDSVDKFTTTLTEFGDTEFSKTEKKIHATENITTGEVELKGVDAESQMSQEEIISSAARVLGTIRDATNSGKPPQVHKKM